MSVHCETELRTPSTAFALTKKQSHALVGSISIHTRITCKLCVMVFLAPSGILPIHSSQTLSRCQASSRRTFHLHIVPWQRIKFEETSLLRTLDRKHRTLSLYFSLLTAEHFVVVFFYCRCVLRWICFFCYCCSC
jgi:hypothetical protein